MMAAMPHCPQCNSPDLSRRHRHGWDKLLSFLFGLYPFICNQCEYTFRTRYHHPSPSEPID